MRWLEGTTNRSAMVLFAESSALQTVRALTTTVPSSGSTITLGSLIYLWKSKHFNFQTPDQHKKLFWVDFTRDIEASGSLGFDVFRDLGTTAFTFAATKSLDLTKAVEEIDVNEVQFQKYVQLQLSSTAEQTGLDFEIFDLSFRLLETENR